MMYAFIGRGLVMIYRNYDYFLTIVKTGSLTKAAEILYITQPSLSKYLSRLEENLNIQLFDRSRSPLTLTYAGSYIWNTSIRLSG